MKLGFLPFLLQGKVNVPIEAKDEEESEKENPIDSDGFREDRESGILILISISLDDVFDYDVFSTRMEVGNETLIWSDGVWNDGVWRLNGYVSVILIVCVVLMASVILIVTEFGE